MIRKIHNLIQNSVLVVKCFCLIQHLIVGLILSTSHILDSILAHPHWNFSKWIRPRTVLEEQFGSSLIEKWKVH